MNYNLKFCTTAILCMTFALASTAMAYEHKFLTDQYWKTATVQDVQNTVNQGADVNMRSTNNAEDGFYLDDTPLMFAARSASNPALIETLIRLGANVNAKSHMGSALIDAASDNTNPAIVQTLLRHGAQTRMSNNFTPLMFAALSNSEPQVIQAIINAGVNVNARSNMGETALMFAAGYTRNPQVVSVLLQNGAYPSPISDNGRTVLQYAGMNKMHAETIKNILKAAGSR